MIHAIVNAFWFLFVMGILAVFVKLCELAKPKKKEKHHDWVDNWWLYW